MLVMSYDTDQSEDIVKPIRGKHRWLIRLWAKLENGTLISQEIIAPTMKEGRKKERCYLSQVLPIAQEVMYNLTDGDVVKAGFSVHILR